MNFEQFLASKYMLAQQDVSKSYSSFKHAKLQAVQSLVNAQRAVFRVLSFPLVIMHYLAVKMHIVKIKSVETIHAEMTTAAQAEANAAKVAESTKKAAEDGAQTLLTALEGQGKTSS